VEDLDSGGAGVDLADVSDDRDAGPVAGEHSPAVRIDLAHPSRARAEVSIEREVEASDPGEAGAGEHLTLPPCNPRPGNVHYLYAVPHDEGGRDAQHR
jgi:hypothetical protein